MTPSLYHQARHRTLREAFVNEDGAIDLASIMVGIIVIGLIGGVIAATIFAVIPWAQDNAAKQQLDSVSNAENAYRGLAEDNGVSAYGAITTTSAGTTNDLANPEFNGKKYDSLLNNVDKLSIITTPGPNPTYTATITSASGKVFTMKNGGQPKEKPGANSNTNPGGSTGNNGTVPSSAPATSSYSASYMDRGTGNNLYDISAEDAYEATLDGNNQLQFGSAGESDPENYDGLFRYVDINSQTWDAKTGIFPTASQFQNTRGPLFYHHIRVDSVTLSDSNGQVGETYTPKTGSVIDLISYPQDDRTDNTYIFKTVLPSDFSATDLALDDIGKRDLTATVTVQGKTIIFHP
jgi:type II secretory pathway pseudopilin PulG